MLAIVPGASILSAGGSAQSGLHAGVLLVILATALWALDNALSSRLRASASQFSMSQSRLSLLNLLPCTTLDRAS